MTDRLWNGAADLAKHLVPIDDVHPHPQNPREGDVDQIAASLERFGQVRAVLVDADGTIIAGNHTWKAAKQLGWTHLGVVANDFKTREEARDYLLADNRLGDLGEYDRAELRVALEELAKTDAWAGTGYELDDLEQMRALDDLVPVEAPDLPPPPPQEPPDGLREVLLLFGQNDADRFTEFGQNLKVLRDKYGTEGVSETVGAAVHQAALRLNQGVTA